MEIMPKVTSLGYFITHNAECLAHSKRSNTTAAIVIILINFEEFTLNLE